MPSNYTTRIKPTSSYTTRPGITFIMTELLDFLMTEDDDYLITDESIYNDYGIRNTINSTYNTRPII